MLHPAKTETGLDIGMHGSAAAAVSLVCAMQLRTSITFMQLQLLFADFCNRSSRIFNKCHFEISMYGMIIVGAQQVFGLKTYKDVHMAQ